MANIGEETVLVNIRFSAETFPETRAFSKQRTRERNRTRPGAFVYNVARSFHGYAVVQRPLGSWARRERPTRLASGSRLSILSRRTRESEGVESYSKRFEFFATRAYSKTIRAADNALLNINTRPSLGCFHANPRASAPVNSRSSTRGRSLPSLSPFSLACSFSLLFSLARSLFSLACSFSLLSSLFSFACSPSLFSFACSPSLFSCSLSLLSCSLSLLSYSLSLLSCSLSLSLLFLPCSLTLFSLLSSLLLTRSLLSSLLLSSVLSLARSLSFLFFLVRSFSLYLSSLSLSLAQSISLLSLSLFFFSLVCSLSSLLLTLSTLLLALFTLHSSLFSLGRSLSLSLSVILARRASLSLDFPALRSRLSLRLRPSLSLGRRRFPFSVGARASSRNRSVRGGRPSRCPKVNRG
ncbi:uncharacterized protein LOC143174450 [Nomia melanderi]|uniref:uncharacterized protein LOC143174450 n=1 Tax=Nomia melanderi TaxID=2448451 RepID=UPI003FCC5F8C